MSIPTFGELLSAADDRLKAAETDPSVTGTELGRHLLRMTAALHRMVNGFCSRGDAAGLPPADATMWEQAATELAAMLELAQNHLASHLNADNPTPLTPAADALAAAGDLLGTHFSGQDGERSEWAEVIASGPVTRALTEEAATWAQRLAPWVHWLGEQNGMAPPFLAASRDLQLAGRVTATAGKAQPVTDDDRALLHAIPTAALAERLPPGEGESVTELCMGLVCTAERLRFVVFRGADPPSWAPVIAARTWQYAATAAAVTMDITAVVLRTLPNGMPNAHALTAARDAWRSLVSALASVTTDTPPALTQETTDLSDLVIRIGRLASGNPRWTPQHPAEPRNPARLPRSASDAANVLAAVHQSTAIRAGRLYVPTRSLPEGYDIPRRYAQMPQGRGGELAGSYAAAASASIAATDPLAAFVLTAGGPSHHIALARQAIRREETASTRTAAPQPATPPGPRLVQRLAALGVADIDLALRAAVIDKAAAELIGEIDRRALRKSVPNPSRTRRPGLCRQALMPSAG